MKTALTPKESKHLISLGVPKEKASEIECDQWEECTPIFSLEDFLNGEILPKETEGKYGTSVLVMTFGGSDLISNIQEWFAYYDGIIESYRYHAEELIDALYQLACWYYGEYLKSEKK